jgi:hypothetical protein
MALKKQELWAGPETIAQKPRLVPRQGGLLVARFSTGTELLPLGTPVAKQKSDGKWVPYTQPSDDAEFTLTNAGGDLDGGSFQLAIDGLVVDAAWNITAANLQTAINAVLADAGKPYTVACVATMGANIGANAAVITITFTENAGAPTVTFNGAGLTDGGVAEPAGIVLAAVDAGASLDETNLIRGFVYEKPVQLDDTDDVLGVIVVRGEVYESDVNTAAIRAVLRGSPSDAEVKAALQEDALQPRILVRGVSGVA